MYLSTVMMHPFMHMLQSTSPAKHSWMSPMVGSQWFKETVLWVLRGKESLGIEAEGSGSQEHMCRGGEVWNMLRLTKA